MVTPGTAPTPDRGVMSISVLVLYDAKGPDIESLAGAVARGIGSAKDASPVLKRIEQANTDDLL